MGYIGFFFFLINGMYTNKCLKTAGAPFMNLLDLVFKNLPHTRISLNCYSSYGIQWSLSANAIFLQDSASLIAVIVHR